MKGTSSEILPVMRARLPLVLVLAVLAACETPPSSGPSAKREKITVTVDLLRAFTDAIHAAYELRFLADPSNSFKATTERDLEPAREAERKARARLAQLLADAGSQEAKRSDRFSDLIPIIKDALVRDRYTFIVEPDSETVSFAVVRLVRAPVERSLEIFGEKWTYDLYVHDETLVEDYSTFRARKLGPPPVRPALTLGRAVYLDMDGVSKIGRETFFPRVPQYKALTAAAEKGEPFVQNAGDLAKLLLVAKDVLRWRSLSTFHATVQALPPAEQCRRFAEYFGAREEIRAACGAYELERARRASGARPAGERLVAIEKRTYDDAIAHDEPLGQVATVVGLAAQLAASDKAKLDPAVEARLKAAASVTLSIIRHLAAEAAPRRGPPPERPETREEDAKDIGRLALASPEALQRAAKAILETGK